MDNEQNLEDMAIVRETGEGFVLVEMQRSGACSSCGLSSFCHGMNTTITHKIKTDEQLSVGDKVKVNIAPELRIKSSLLIFLLPIFSMISFFCISRYAFNLSEPLSILFSFFGLVISGVVLYLVDKKMAEAVNFQIVERIEQ